MSKKSALSSEKIIKTAEKRKATTSRGRKKTTAKSSAKSKAKAISRKIKTVTKGVVKKVVRRKKTASKPASVEARQISVGAPAEQVLASLEDVLITPQERIEDAKFFVAEQQGHTVESPVKELPQNYGDNKITLMVRDPWWVFSYWELQEGHVLAKKRELPAEEQDSASFILRVYDVSYIEFDGNNAHYFMDVTVPFGTDRWYVNVSSPGRSWLAEMGWLSPSGKFVPVVRSNVVQTPLDGPSWITDEEWLIPEELFNKLYGLSIGFGGIGLSSGEISKIWREQSAAVMGSGAVSSFGMSSFQAVKEVEQPKPRKFWMVVNTELILYGATEPDAKVTVQGKPIKLNPDGTFSLRFALPDGMQVIPVTGRSSDGIDEITITPVVNKETR